MRQVLSWMGVVALLTGITGCAGSFPSWMMVKDDAAPTPMVPPPGEHVVVEKPPEGPKRAPHTETLIKWAQLFEATAAQSPDSEQQLRSLDKAKQAYLQARTQDPKNAQITLGLARVYEAMSNFDQVEATYQTAFNDMPEESQLWFQCGMYQCRRRHWEQGVDCLRRAASLEPNNAQYAKALAFTLARVGRNEESLAEFRRILGDARAKFQVAQVALHLGQEEAGRQYLLAALKVDPNLREAKELLEQLDNPPAEDGTSEAAQPKQPVQEPHE